MNIYDFKTLEKCYVCGNIDRNIDKFIQRLTSNLSNYVKVEHPKELERQERLRNRQNHAMNLQAARRFSRAVEEELRNSMKKLKSKDSGTYNNSVIIVSGNCGIGSKSMNYYNEMFEKLNKVLSENNCFLLFVRGNNDDPSYFKEQKINFSNVKTICDYSVVILKFFNCLCIGGSVSLDKEWKLSQQEQFGKKLFWEDEEPFFDEKELDEILKKYQIGCVVTSTSPSWAFPGTNAYNKSKWITNNPSIKSAFSSERKVLDKVYGKFMDVDVKPYIWLYGRFKQNNHTRVNDILFDSLGAFQIEDVNNMISSYFGIDLSKKLGGNIFTFDSFIPEEKKDYGVAYVHHDEPMEEEGDVEEEVGEENELNDILYDLDEAAHTNEARDNYGGYRITTEDVQDATRQMQEAIAAVNTIQQTRAQENVNEARGIWAEPGSLDWYLDFPQVGTATTAATATIINGRH